jgi:hypothetical protein
MAAWQAIRTIPLPFRVRFRRFRIRLPRGVQLASSSWRQPNTGQSRSNGPGDLDFDSSSLDYCKRTSPELLNVRPSVRVVAQRQGHLPRVVHGK